MIEIIVKRSIYLYCAPKLPGSHGVRRSAGMATSLQKHAAAPGARHPPARQGRHSMGTKAVHQAVLRTIHGHVSSKQRSAVEVTTQYLEQLKSVEGNVKSFLTVDEQGALKQAAAVDAAIAAGSSPGLLAGVPIAIKDNICTEGVRTTAGSRILDTYTPPYDATAVAKLRAAGAVLIGKTNMDEFGMGSTTENSAYQVTTNPWDATCVPGGSSGGSAAAVAAHQCAAALGSDTGGSIRQPAHFCGVVGLKPSYGRVSRYGLIAYASSLDVIGPMATSVEDAARVLQVIAGDDSHDATCSSSAVPDFLSGLAPPEQLSSRPLEGKTVGVIRETLGQGVDPGVEAAVRGALSHLEQLGATIKEVSLPSTGAGLPAYYVLAVSEASSNLSRYDGVRYGVRAQGADELRAMYDGSRGTGLGAEVKRRILMGTYALSAGYYDAYYKRAQQVRTLVQQEMLGALEGCDILVSPAAPTPAYPIGGKTSDPLSMYKEDLMTVSLNLSGLPAVVVPAGLTDRPGAGQLPVGVQMIGRMFGEAQLLAVAHAFEVTRGPLGASPPACAAAAAAAAAPAAALAV